MAVDERVDFDVLIIGAGISGINAAFRVQEQSPDRSYALFEARDSIGGTWDLFKYPGIRSDSDLHTFGFPWRPWPSSNTIADGKSIVEYVKDCASIYGIDKNIRYKHKMTAANWSSEDQYWTVQADVAGAKKTFRVKFMIHATGYYDYDKPLEADIPGIDNFQGQTIHPQFWPEDLDYTGKNIVVIGSGATAITLLPVLAEKAAHVTMLQRSPTYIMTLPKVDPTGEFLKMILPHSWAYQLIRLKFLILPFLFFKFCRAFPSPAKKILLLGAKRQLPKGYPVAPNLTPSYGPWEQRLCVCPDGDFYKAISGDRASVVTAHIDKVTEKSITLKNNDKVLRPDIIVTATGLRVRLLGGANVTVDGTPVRMADKFLWKGALVEGVPNTAIIIGYTNASWTLGADATSQLVTRLLNSMREKGQSSVTPTMAPDSNMVPAPVLNLNSTYVVKAKGELPKAGTAAPWLPRSTYFTDIWEARYGSVTQDMVYQ